nr:hypothetical protein CFP56_52869 [Quercus suber]
MIDGTELGEVTKTPNDMPSDSTNGNLMFSPRHICTLQPIICCQCHSPTSDRLSIVMIIIYVYRVPVSTTDSFPDEPLLPLASFVEKVIGIPWLISHSDVIVITRSPPGSSHCARSAQSSQLTPGSRLAGSSEALSSILFVCGLLVLIAR